ncbi:MAG: methyl-accepting chemotaxis protein [Frankiales bacterium]|nr:methyl-accepting chemotaxis protein [Frankiales bacterium]
MLDTRDAIDVAAVPADVVRRVLPVPTGLPRDVERDLAALVGVAAPPPADHDTELDDDLHHDAEPKGGGRPDFAHRLLRVAEFVTFGAFVLLVASAMLAARFGDGSLHVHELPFAGWGLGATVSALALAALSGDAYAEELRPTRRRVISGLLMLALLGCVTGVVANSDGVAGPAWVLFLPVVLVAGAVSGPTLGLLVGAGAAAGVYVAAGLSDTLTVAGVGRLVVLLPAFPAVGWSAGALAGLARAATLEAQDRRHALESDVRSISAVLDRVAAGDLSVVPGPGEHADPVATSLAVAFADTLLALRRLVRQMDTVSDQLASSSIDLAGAAEQEAGAVETQVAAVAETTMTIEQLASTAATIAETAVRVSQFAGSTRRDVDAGASAVADATAAMGRIAESVSQLDARAEALAERIARIAQTTHSIDELARRTSVLAVNASIEAARAGEHGSGFGTVADEVRTLAARARDATARISGIVGELEAEAAATAAASHDGHEAVQVGTALQEDVVAALSRIAAMVDRTTAASREITEATRMQRVASDAVVSAMTTVTGASDRYRAGSRRHAEAAGRLRDLAEGLRSALGRFKVT